MVEDSESPIARFLEGAREKSGSEVDYSNLVIIGMAQVLASQVGSGHRANALADLHDLLAPFQDEDFKAQWTMLNVRFFELDGNNGHDTGRLAIKWHREWLVLLIRLMKRQGMLPLGMI